MTRRAFIPAAAGVAAAVAGTAEPSSRAILELTYYHLRNGSVNQRQRVSQFLEQTAMPAMKKSGGAPSGVFTNMIGGEGAFLMTLTSFPSLAAFEQTRDKLMSDGGYVKALDAFNAQPGLSYERADRMLLRAFPAMPQIQIPNHESGKPSHVFEVRRYESNNLTTLREKVKMFGSGEIDIFRRLGMQPVFFGEMLVGPKMPNLVYMLTFDDLAAREQAWRAFGSDPAWQKLRATPGWSDPEIVSNITNFIVSPLPFSPIR